MKRQVNRKQPKITEFQGKVYLIVKKIPRGKTASYADIAHKLKTSPRAVGQALARNPFPIKIPCHRVIHKNGKLGGYKLGEKRKAQLLRKEGVEV